tara:strand:+ start:683 stop:1567 length:885 start_codon:yes stop_codon:yes gene_type:complete
MSILSKLKIYARKKLNIDGDVEHLQKQIHFLSALVNFSGKDRMEPNPTLKDKLMSYFQKERGLEELYFPVHKNDIMFLYHLYHHESDTEEAFKSYYNVGLNIAGSCAGLIQKHQADTSSVLDFGSGYGRVSRFLPFYFPDAKIHVSEIKPDALLFQKDEFGFGIVTHSHLAESFPEKSFDVIIAGSVFTHLPQDLFENWFRVLCRSISPKGMVMFSYNNIERIAKPHNPDIHYTSQSEDSFFRVSDRLADDNTYGLTFVSQNYLSQLASKNGLEIFFETEVQLAKQKIAVLKHS